jgi:hypothetical protein
VIGGRRARRDTLHSIRVHAPRSTPRPDDPIETIVSAAKNRKPVMSASAPAISISLGIEERSRLALEA